LSFKVKVGADFRFEIGIAERQGCSFTLTMPCNTETAACTLCKNNLLLSRVQLFHEKNKEGL
jgi:hypothetical protein